MSKFSLAIEEKKSIATKMQHVIFLDLDDTLVRYASVLSQGLFKAKQKICEETKEKLPDTPTVFTGKEYKETMIEAFGEKHKEKGDEYYQLIYNGFEYPIFPAIEGAAQFLHKALAAKINLAIISNDTTAEIWKKLLQQIFTKSPAHKELIKKICADPGKILPNALAEIKRDSFTKEQKLWFEILLQMQENKNFTVIGSDKGGKKPDPSSGINALKILNVDLSKPLSVCHFGDGLGSDLFFAKNLDMILKENNRQSTCQFFHFGMRFDYATDKPYYFTSEEKGIFDHVYGFGKSGKIIRDIFVPKYLEITPGMLLTQKKLLKNYTNENRKNTRLFTTFNEGPPKIRSGGLLISLVIGIAVVFKLYFKQEPLLENVVNFRL